MLRVLISSVSSAHRRIYASLRSHVSIVIAASSWHSSDWSFKVFFPRSIVLAIFIWSSAATSSSYSSTSSISSQPTSNRSKLVCLLLFDFVELVSQLPSRLFFNLFIISNLLLLIIIFVFVLIRFGVSVPTLFSIIIFLLILFVFSPFMLRVWPRVFFFGLRFLVSRILFVQWIF